MRTQRPYARRDGLRVVEPVGELGVRLGAPGRRRSEHQPAARSRSRHSASQQLPAALHSRVDQPFAAAHELAHLLPLPRFRQGAHDISHLKLG